MVAVDDRAAIVGGIGRNRVQRAILQLAVVGLTSPSLGNVTIAGAMVAVLLGA